MPHLPDLDRLQVHDLRFDATPTAWWRGPEATGDDQATFP